MGDTLRRRVGPSRHNNRNLPRLACCRLAVETQDGGEE